MSEASKAQIAKYFQFKQNARELGLSVKEYKNAHNVARLLSGLEPDRRDSMAPRMTQSLSEKGREVAIAYEEEFREIRARLGHLPIGPA